MTHQIPAIPDEIKANEALFREAMRPIADAGKLGCLLAQFPFSFRRSEGNLDYIRGLNDRLGKPLVVEFRNHEWAVEETRAALAEMGIGYCCVDEPALKGLMPREAVATSRIAYVRFHGRNAAKWWKHEQPWERYDYLYSDGELKEWLPGLADLAERTDVTYVLFNNCHAGQAARNAGTMQALLGLAAPQPDPSQAADRQIKLF